MNTNTALSVDESAAQSDTASAFAFVAELAREVSNGRVELPSFPEVAVRVRKVLADEDVSNEQIARVVGSDAGLAARVFTLANSAAFNPSGRTVTDLKGAINRIGHNNVRTAAVSFAIAQLRRASELQEIAGELAKLWKEATLAAALAHAIASRVRVANADEALLAGLLHNVGKLYILARANRHAQLFKDPETLAHVIRDWHANVGKAIVENWEFPEHIVEAVAEHENLDRDAASPDMTDVLTVAVTMAAFMGHEVEDFELNMLGVKAFARLNLDNAKCEHIMNDCAEEIVALQSALGD
ncbi:MAG: hypothetical protein DIU71_15845 [Proteobacteria bacterium]|nr:MAG: hypothetical protein DIU71_15845 [Pseudomonadota bacterium]